MSARRLPAWTWILLGVLAMGCVGAQLLAHASEGPRRTWFCDLNTGALFAVPYGTLPPVAAPSGDLHGAPPGTPAGVEAMVLEPVAGGEPLIAYLTTREAGAPPPDPARPEAGDPGRLVRLPDGRRWVRDGSPESRAVYDNAALRAAGRPHRQAFPR